MRPSAWGRTSHRGCGYGPQHRPGQDPARKRVEQFRPVDRETRPLNGCGGVSAQVASGIRLDHSGVRRSCQRARLPQPCAGRLSRRRRPWLNRGPGHGCALGRRQASPRTITHTAANTASSGWNPIHASSAASKHTSPRPGGHRQLPGIPVAAPLPPPGQQETTAGQPGQQYPRHPPVAERSTRQHGRVRPQQRPHPGRSQTAHPQPGPQPRSPAPTRPAPAGEPDRPVTSASPRSIAHTPTLQAAADPGQGRKST